MKHTTSQQTLRVIDNLECLSDKELDALYDKASPVKSPTHHQYEALRAELIRRGNLISA